jgi:RNA-binding protein
MNKEQEKILSPKQRQSLKKMAHHLKPVVNIGKKGLTPALIQEINQALAAHELIKIQIISDEKPPSKPDIPALVAQTDSYHVANIGNVIILFRKKEKNSAYEELL